MQSEINLKIILNGCCSIFYVKSECFNRLLPYISFTVPGYRQADKYDSHARNSMICELPGTGD